MLLANKQNKGHLIQVWKQKGGPHSTVSWEETSRKFQGRCFLSLEAHVEREDDDVIYRKRINVELLK